MTLDEMIEKLKEIREKAIYGGETAMVLCLSNSGIQDRMVEEVELIQSHLTLSSVVEIRATVEDCEYDRDSYPGNDPDDQ